MYRRYYSYNDMPTVTKKQLPKAEKIVPQKRTEPTVANDNKFLGLFETDDIILLVVVLVLLMDDCDDKLLLLALGFIFLNF